jgi:hypothetical protein
MGFQILKIKGVLRHVEVLAQDLFPKGFAGSNPSPRIFFFHAQTFQRIFSPVFQGNTISVSTESSYCRVIW